MSDEVDAALGVMRRLFGAGEPSRTQATGDLVRAAGAKPSAVSWEGAGRNGYNSRNQTNKTDGMRLAGTDDKVPPKVGESAEDTHRGRQGIDRTTTSYRNGKAALSPVRGTATGEAAMLGLKTNKLGEGAAEVTARRRNQAERAQRIRAYSSQLARAQQGQQQAANLVRQQQQQMQAAMRQQMMIQAAQQAAQQAASQTANTAGQAATTGASALRSNKSPGTGNTGLRTRGGSSAGRRIAEIALKRLGTPYVWGGGGKDGPTGGGFDCSSLAMYSTYQATGVELPRTTYDQINRGVRVDPGSAQPGDLVFSNFSKPGVPEHVQIYIGGGRVVEEPQPGGQCQISQMPSNVVVKRIVN